MPNPNNPIEAGAPEPSACNAHCHVFGPADRFPYAPDAPYLPERDAPREALQATNDRLGFARCVVVQPLCHGFDNRVTQDAVASRPGDYVGVALLPTDVVDGELRRLHTAGFRGVRFNFMAGLSDGAPAEEVLALARRIAPLGWHLQVHGEPGRVLVDMASAWRRAPVPVVVDHLGRVDASLGLDQPHVRALLALVDQDHCWVKASQIEQVSRQGPPYHDAAALARHLLERVGDRVVWGNDWPHPQPKGLPPDDDALAAAISAIAPTAKLRRALLIDNPARLYGFGDPGRLPRGRS